MATISVKVLDGLTGYPLADASVVVANSTGVYLGQGVKTDSQGKASLTSSLIDGNYILVSFIDYQSLLVDPTLLEGTDYTTVNLMPTGQVLQQAVVTPGSDFPWWIPVLGVGLALLVGAASHRQKKRRVYG